MKKFFFLFISTLYLVAGPAQNYTWTKMQSLPHGLYSPASFTIGDKIYAVCGATVASSSPKVLTNQVWEYNTTTNNWSQKNNFPGTAVYAAGGFTIGGMGYMVNGWDSSASGSGPSILWQYNPSSDSWAQKAHFPGSTRYTCATFVLNNKAYVALGFSPYCNDMYEYDPTNDTWTQKANFPGLPRQAPIWFTIGNYAYVGMGPTAGDYQVSDFYRYDPSNNSWLQMADFPSDPLQSSYSFEMNGEGYVVNGLTQDNLNYTIGASNKIWKYTAGTNSWAFWGVFPDTAIFYGITARVGNAAFIGLGAANHFTYPCASMLWRYGPAVGSTSCNATINTFRLSNAYFNYQAAGNFSPSAVLTWHFGDGTSATGSSVNHSYGAVGNYAVNLLVTDTAGSGCSASSADTIHVTGLSTCGVTIANTSILGQTTLYTHTTGFGPYTYSWSCQQDPSFHSSSPDPIVFLQPNSSTTYCVTITDTTGCSATACKQFTYVPHADSCKTYLYIFPQGQEPGLYYGYCYHIGADPVSYSWTFGDGQTSPDSLPTHTYGFSDFYYICLTITDANNCVSSYCDSFFYAYKKGGGPMKKLQIIARYAAGIEDNSAPIAVSVSPNPAKNALTLKYTLAASDEVQIGMVNQLGEQVISRKVTAEGGKLKTENLNLSGLAAGTYLVTFNSKRNGHYVERIIVE